MKERLKKKTTKSESKNSKATTKLQPSTIRIGHRYRSNRLRGPYDVVVIGSGVGGLTTAVALSKKGKKVVVLEQHYTAGGMTHSYARNGYEWDVGVHYIGDVGYPTLARKLFDFISAGNLKWAAMDSIYDRIFIGSDQYDFIAGKENFKTELKRKFPSEQKAIDKYIDMLGTVNKAMRWYTLGKLLTPLQRRLLNVIERPFLPKYFNLTTYDALRKITNNERLIAVLTGQWGDCGLTPKHSSFIIHSLIAKHYLNGGYYPVGGASKIAETAIPQIQASGGEVFTYAEVTNILYKKGRVVGVQMKDGTEILAPVVVSNVGVFNTFQKLLSESVTKKFGYHRLLKKVKPSMTHFGMYIGLKGTVKSLNLPKTNFWIYPDEQHDANMDSFLNDETNSLPVVYISFPSAKDPSFEQRYPGRATIEIVAPANFDRFSDWQDSSWGKRGKQYEAIKEVFAQRILTVMYEKLPQLKGKVDYYEVSTPLSTKYFCYYNQGETYGLDHDPERFNQSWLQAKTKIPGLYLTGQDALSCGVAGAMFSGLLTAIKILNWRQGVELSKMVFMPDDPVKPPYVVAFE